MIRLRWLPAAAVCALLALAPPALAENWTAPATWSTPGEAIGQNVFVSVTTSGDALAVWSAGGAAKARWQYADGTFSAVFDPLAASGLAGTPTITGARTWGSRQAVITYTGSTDVSDVPTSQATFGLYARRVADTTLADPIPVATSTATRSIGGSTSLLVAGGGTAVVGWYDAARPATVGTTDVRYSFVRILDPALDSPGPVQPVDQERDRTTSDGLGTLTAAGTEQPLLWLNEGGTGVLATRPLKNPDDATTPAPRKFRLRPFNLFDGVTAGSPFTLLPNGPDPFAIGSSALSIGPTGEGALFYSLLANSPPALEFGTGLAGWAGSPLAADLAAPLDLPNGSQTVIATRDGAGRTIVAWSGRFDASPHQSLTLRRLDTGFGQLGPDEEFTDGRLAALVGTAKGARLIMRKLVNGSQWELIDREVPTGGLSGQPRQVLPAEANLALATTPERSADGTVVLPLRRRGDDGKDVLWVMRLPGTDGPPTGGGGDDGVPVGGGAPTAAAGPKPASPAATPTLALRRTTTGVVKIPAKGSATVKLRCTASTACTVRLTARNAKKTTLATLRGTIPAGKAAGLKLVLTKAGRALVRRKGRKATLRLAGTIAAGGKTRSTSLTLTIRR